MNRNNLLHIFIFLFTFTFVSANAIGQKNDKASKKERKKAESLVRKGKLNEAREIYENLLNSKEFEDPEIYLEAGICIYKTNVRMEASLPIFEKALEKSITDTIPELLLYLGKANHFIGDFEKGIQYFNLFRANIETKTKDGSTILSDVERYIENCNNGIEIQGQQTNNYAVIDQLGVNINTTVNDFAPLVNDPQDLLIFCSRRPASGKIDLDKEYFENVYFSEKIDGEWSKSEKLFKSKMYEEMDLTKVKGHVAPISISADGKTLFIYQNGDIFKSVINKDGLWDMPKKLKANVNIGEFNPSVYISPDSSELYIVSVGNFDDLTKPVDKTAQFGRKDIYYSKRLSDGSWSESIRLGENINTPYDEDAPFVTQDGNTLYFASTGHNSIGGYDIFKCEKTENGNWSKPINVGTPLNSAGDDIYYIESKTGTVGFFASRRPKGVGHLDIYYAEMECQNIPNTEINGYAVLASNGKPFGGKVKLINKETGEEFGDFLIDNETGKYQMIVPPGATYVLEMIASDYNQSRPHREEIIIPKQCENYHLFQQIELDHIKNEKGENIAQKAHFKNAFMDIHKESKIFFEKDELDFADSDFNKNKQSGFNLSGQLNHNEILAAEKVQIMLLNENYEVIRTTSTSNEGKFYFSDLDKSKKYKILIDEESTKISMNGDSEFNGANKIVLEGNLKFYELENNFTFAGKDIEIIVADQNKNYIDYETSDLSGNFKFKSANQQKVEQLNAENSLKYNYDVSTPEIAYTAYISHLDPKNNEVNYSEFIDIIDLEQGELEIPEELKEDFANLLFDFDKFFLRTKSKNILENLTKYMTKNTNVNIKLGGHTDHIGADEYNLVLSKKRAESAFTYLVKNGISENRLSSVWFGEKQPSSPNTNTDGTDNPEGRQLNRRVEIHVTMPEVGEVILSLR